MQLPEHGANPHHVYAKVGLDLPQRVLDFSENVNPAGPPQAVIAMWPDLLAEIGSYPGSRLHPGRHRLQDLGRALPYVDARRL